MIWRKDCGSGGMEGDVLALEQLGGKVLAEARLHLFSVARGSHLAFDINRPRISPLRSRTMMQQAILVRSLSDLRRADIALVGGKNASLGEMIGMLRGAGIKVAADGSSPAAPAFQGEALAAVALAPLQPSIGFSSLGRSASARERRPSRDTATT